MVCGEHLPHLDEVVVRQPRRVQREREQQARPPGDRVHLRHEPANRREAHRLAANPARVAAGGHVAQCSRLCAVRRAWPSGQRSGEEERRSPHDRRRRTPRGSWAPARDIRDEHPVQPATQPGGRAGVVGKRAVPGNATAELAHLGRAEQADPRPGRGPAEDCRRDQRRNRTRRPSSRAASGREWRCDERDDDPEGAARPASAHSPRAVERERRSGIRRESARVVTTSATALAATTPMM